MMSIEELRAYIEDWRTDCQTVGNLIRWSLFETDETKTLAKCSRPGAFLADFMFTLLAIERRATSPESDYVAIKTGTYVNLADKLDIRNDYFRSASNTSNLMQCLVWFAYEQKRYHFIMTVVKLAMDLEYPHVAPVGDSRSAYSTSSVVLPPVSEQPQQADDVASQSASKRAYGHAAAVAPGHAKLPRTTTTRAREDSSEHAGWKDAQKASWESSGDASWSRQGNSQRDVQETAAEKARCKSGDKQSTYIHTAASASSHAAAATCSKQTRSL